MTTYRTTGDDWVTYNAETAARLGKFIADTIGHDPANADPDEMARIATKAAHYANNS